MNNIVVRCYIGILVTTLCACVATPPIPDWVTEKSLRYTRTSYITARGVDPVKQAAYDKAQLALTQQFKSLASTDEQTSQTNIIINQIAFEKPWKNFETNDYHVLAFLSREKISGLIQKKMLALDELTYEFFERAKGTSDLLEQSSYIDSALDSQIRRSKFKPILILINGQSDFPSSYNIKRLTKIRDTLLRRINLQVKVIQQPNTNGLLEVLKTKLDSIGFIRDDTKYSQNHLLVEIKYALSSTPESSNEFLIQGVLNTSLKNNNDNGIRGIHNWTFNLTAQDKNTALQQVSQLLKKQINENLKHVVMDIMLIEYDNTEISSESDFADIDMPEFNQVNTQKQKPTKTVSSKPSIQSKTELKAEKTSNQSENNSANSDTATNDNTQLNNISPENINAPQATSSKLNESEVEHNDSNTSDPITSNNTATQTQADSQTIAPTHSTIISDDPISNLPALERAE